MSVDGGRLWVVDDDEAIRFVLERALSKAGYEVATFDTVAAVQSALAAGPWRRLRQNASQWR